MASKDFLVRAGLVVSTTANITGAAALSNTISVTGNATFSNAIAVTGNATFSNSIAVTGTAGITGAATFSNTITVTGNATFSNTISVAGDATVSGSLTVTGNLTLAGTTTFVNSTVITTNDLNLVLANSTSTNALANTAGLKVGTSASLLYNSTVPSWQANVGFTPAVNNLTLGSATQQWNLFANTGTFYGNTTHTGGATFSNTISVTGNATFSSPITVGTAVIANTTAFFVGNSTANAYITSAGLFVNGSAYTITSSSIITALGYTPYNNTNPSSFANSTNSAAINGNAGTVTNGVYTSGSYSDPTWLTISKSKVGLGNVDNTADASKSVSSAVTANTATYLSATAQVNLILGRTSGFTMALSDTTQGSFTCRANTTAGDTNLAGLTFWHDSYAIKLGVRNDGVFSLGGWSRAAHSWYSDASGNMVAAGNVTAYSDPKLKENFERVKNPLDILDKLDGGTFNWKSGITHTECKAGKRDYGILADQVEVVMPEIVTDSIEIDGDTYKTVSYEKLVPVLIEAIKELKARVQELEGKA
jgi:hypothetical protein